MRLKKTILVLLLALFVGVVGVGIVGCEKIDDSGEPNEPLTKVDCSFTVMSYNVRTLNIDLSETRNPNDDISVRGPLMISEIRKADPDIIGVQEWLFAHEAAMLNELNDDYEYIAVSRDGSIIGEMCAILYKSERFELVDTHTYWVSETPEVKSKGWDAKLYRICTVANLKDKKNGKVIRFGNVHLDNVAKLASENGTKLVIDRAGASEYPAIQVGDFNYDITSKNYEYCIENMDDARLVAPNAFTTSTYNGWNEKKIMDGGNPIDHCLVTKDAFNILSYEVYSHKVDGLFASDHFPVVIKMELKD